MTTTRNHIIWLRVIAALLVVIGHGMLISADLYEENSDVILRIVDFIYMFHVPLFMTISGYLFEYTEVCKHHCSTPLIEFIKKRFFRLMMPFFIIMFLYTKPIKFLTGVYSELDLHFLLATHHLWYLYVLFVVLIIAKIVVDHMHGKCPPRVFMAICICMNIASVWFEGPVHHILFYCYYFLLGMLLCRAEEAGKRFLEGMVVSICLWLVSLGIGSLLQERSVVLIAINKLSTSSAIIILLFLLFARVKGRSLPKVIKVLGDYCMGIYLFHEPMMNIFSYWIPAKWSGVWVYSIIMSSICVFGSMCITFLIRKLHLFFMIGE